MGDNLLSASFEQMCNQPVQQTIVLQRKVYLKVSHHASMM